MTSSTRVPTSSVKRGAGDKVSRRRGVPRLLKRPGTAIGLVLAALLLLIVAMPGLFTDVDPNALDVKAVLAQPSAEHLLGTDNVGRDIYARVIYGTRVTLSIVLSSLALSLVFGGLAGVISGFFGRTTDMLLGRAVDVILSFPPFILGVMVTGILGPNTRNLILALAVIYFPTFFRIGRSGALSESTKVYAEAAYSLGYPRLRILTRHLLPNVTPSLLAQFMVVFPLALQIQAALSFLGLGIQPPTPDWGNILESGKNYLLAAPWMSVFPGLAILIAALAAVLLGRAAQQAVDER
jgi:peptide/nickel transport system permease protein